MNKQELIEKYEKLEGVCKDPGAEIARLIFLEDLRELDGPQKVQVPQFVADWYEKNKDDFETKLFNAIDSLFRNFEDDDLNAFEEWIIDGHTAPFQTLVNMHQFGYEVEKEKRYLVKMKGVDSRTNYLYYGTGSKTWLFKTKFIDGTFRRSHTRKELEEAGFGEVLNSPLFEVEEVKNDFTN